MFLEEFKGIRIKDIDEVLVPCFLVEGAAVDCDIDFSVMSAEIALVVVCLGFCDDFAFSIRFDDCYREAPPD